jgi:hypothetical protein
MQQCLAACIQAKQGHSENSLQLQPFQVDTNSVSDIHNNLGVKPSVGNKTVQWKTDFVFSATLHLALKSIIAMT